jgi:hypothetical protein
VTIYTLDDGVRSLPNRYHRYPSDLSLHLNGTAIRERRSSSNEQNDQDDQEDGAKSATNIRAADVEATAAKHKHQDDN